MCSANPTLPLSLKPRLALQGVLLMLQGLPGGPCSIQRIRFARHLFSREAADRWWARHRDAIAARYGLSPDGADLADGGGAGGGAGGGGRGPQAARMPSDAAAQGYALWPVQGLEFMFHDQAVCTW